MTRIVQHGGISRNVKEYRAAHAGVNIFENNRGGFVPNADHNVTMGLSQARKYLGCRTQALKASRGKKRSASSPKLLKGVSLKKDVSSRLTVPRTVTLSDMLPVVDPNVRVAVPAAKNRKIYEKEVKAMMKAALKKKKAAKRKSKPNLIDAIKANRKLDPRNQRCKQSNSATLPKKTKKNPAVEADIQKEIERIKARKAEEKNALVLAAKAKQEKAKQMEYERKVAVERVANSNVRKRQPKKRGKQKPSLKNVTKAITPRFGRAREKKNKRKKGDGLRSHVKVYRDIAITDAASGGDPYEGQRAQVCLATPKPCAGFKLVWMW